MSKLNYNFILLVKVVCVKSIILFITTKGSTIIRKQYQTEYIQFTDEQKQRAAGTDLAAFLISQGENLKRCGSEMLWENGGRVTIRENMWYSHYEQTGGNAIQFIQRFYSKSYQDAVQILLDEKIEPLSIELKKQKKEKKHFELPKANNDMRQVFAYLLKSRFIDRDIVEYFAHEKLLYESEEYHNCVFVGIDKNGIPRHAHKRGTYTLGESFKGNVDDCDSEYSFHYTGTSDNIYVFEAPIDMLSFITLHKKDWQEHSYVSLCSVADCALMRMLKDNPNISKIYLCLDNDAKGIEAEYRIRNSLKEIGYTDVSFLRPKYKDWNEILRARNGLVPLPAVEHPTLNKMRELLRETVPEAVKSNTLLFPFKTLSADYQRLIASQNDELIAKNAHLLARDSIRMAKALLNADEKELMCGVFEKYLPHTDATCFENKMKNIKYDMETVERLFGNDQIRIASVLKQDVKSLYRLTCDSLKIQLHIEMGLSENFIIEQKGSDSGWAIRQA